jgi:arginine vasopressin receptor 1A
VLSLKYISLISLSLSLSQNLETLLYQMSRMYYFILHLSLADLLTAFFTLLPEIVWSATWPDFYGGNAVCKIVKFGQMVGPYLSSYVLIMTAIDRFQVGQ